MLKKTKIVATIGPASAEPDILEPMLGQGVDICRLNFSHGEHADHRRVIQAIRAYNEKHDTNIGILADLQGPKLRVGEVENGAIDLTEGEKFVLSTKDQKGSGGRIPINYEKLPRDVNPGEQILFDDGKITTEVCSTNGTDEVEVKVLQGGQLASKKGVNLPNTAVSIPCLTGKDRNDLDFALGEEVDWIGLSFVRSGTDLIELKDIIASRDQQQKVIAKIEKPEALEDIDAVIENADALMVARGDLGVEIPMQNVPMIQKMLIQKCLRSAKPVIVATQMMESMIHNISPSRAEVNDVANAVLDGADAVMLSGETSIGNHPQRVIEAMNKICTEVEKSDTIYYHEKPPEYNEERFISDSICYNAARLAKRVDAQGILTMTHSGYTGFKLSSQRPKAPIFVFTGNRQLLSKLNLVWGVKGFYYDKFVSTDHTIADIKYILRKEGYVQEHDLVINIASMPIAEKGKTNMLKLSHI